MFTERIKQNVSRAKKLHTQLAYAGRDYGCFEISLTALGANFDANNIPPQNHAYLDIDTVEQAGFKVNWKVGTNQQVLDEEITALLAGEVPFDEECPGGNVVGYLWSEHYPDGRAHMKAILPEELNSYLVIDSGYSGGNIKMSAPEIAYLCNVIVEKGGSFEILQIKQLQTEPTVMAN